MPRPAFHSYLYVTGSYAFRRGATQRKGVMQNIIVLDLETLQSANEVQGGWANKSGLGLSIGGYWDYAAEQFFWFGEETLLDVVRYLTAKRPLLVSFNGIRFDFALMRAVVRHTLIPRDHPGMQADIEEILQSFKRLASSSYDILAEIWRTDAQGKFEGGLNSLDAHCAANGLGRKTGNGAQAPRDWQAGKKAKIIAYCATDIALTVELFELIRAQEGQIMRSNGPLQLQRWVNKAGEIVSR